MLKKNQKNFTKKLTESAVMLALTLVLSYVKLLDLPYGGSITLCSMLPPIFIAYRYGMLWGFGIGVANGFLQLLMGLNTLSYATSATAAVAIIMLDYVIAFAVSGFGGIFKHTFKNQSASLLSGVALVCILRYICHVISGCTVWAGLSIPNGQAIVYSLAYNATYMLPELIIALAGAMYLSGAIDFNGENLTRISKQNETKKGFILKAIGSFLGLAAFITDILIVAPKLQNAETGDFDITGIASVNFTALIIVTVAGAVAMALFFALSRIKSKR
jgi:thiamine transporter